MMTAEIDALFNQNIGALAASLEKALQSASGEYEHLKQAGEIGEVSRITISFLQSGVMCRLPWLRVDFCDDDGMKDSAECSATWDVPCVSDAFYRNADMTAKERELRKEYETEQIWLENTNQYYQAFERFLPQIIDRCAIAQTVDCSWHFGLYLGNTVVLRERRGDEIL